MLRLSYPFQAQCSYILQGFQESAFLEYSSNPCRMTSVPPARWLWGPLGYFLTPASSLTPAGCSIIQLNSDTISRD